MKTLSLALTIALLSFANAAVARAELLIHDDTGRALQLRAPARRIISLAPHITEILFAAGAGEHVVGVVAYSDYPAAALKLTHVGSASNIDMEAVAALQPDLVIAWASGNRSAHLGKLEALGIPVYLNEARRLDDIARSIEAFGRLAGTESMAARAAASFRARKDDLVARHRDRAPVRVFYQIWSQPLMTVNGEHLISDVIRLCGGENVFAPLPQLTPTISVEAVLAADPEVIVASGMDASRPQWLDQWTRWPGLKANRSHSLYFIPPELIQRHAPRILEGAAQMCGFLDDARAKRDAPSRQRRS